MTVSPHGSEIKTVQLSDLARHKAHAFNFIPDRAFLTSLQSELGLVGLSKVRLSGKLHPTGRRDWDVEGVLGATVTQSCVATLAPVRTRIDDTFRRSYREFLPDLEQEDEIEMPDDESLERLPAVLDLAEILTEVLELSLPAYPRVEDAELESRAFSEPGTAPMTDEDARPFAGLAALRDQGNEDDDT